MRVCDFSRSFVTFHLPLNNARIQVEARCWLKDADTKAEEYLLFASCKSEDTYGAGELFTRPNYDFSGIFSSTEYRIDRIHADQSLERDESGITVERFNSLTRHVREVDAEPLEDIPAIVEATLAHRIIIGRTTVSAPDGSLTAVIEYPVKTMNVHRENVVFQVDTGPVPLYNFAQQGERPIQNFEWAYVACRDFNSADFIIQAPTPIERDGVAVATTTHYSVYRRHATARNEFFAFD